MYFTIKFENCIYSLSCRFMLLCHLTKPDSIVPTFEFNEGNYFSHFSLKSNCLPPCHYLLQHFNTKVLCTVCRVLDFNQQRCMHIWSRSLYNTVITFDYMQLYKNHLWSHHYSMVSTCDYSYLVFQKHVEISCEPQVIKM